MSQDPRKSYFLAMDAESGAEKCKPHAAAQKEETTYCLVSGSNGIDVPPPMVAVAIFHLTTGAGGHALWLSVMDHPCCITPRGATQVRGSHGL